jgi:hypothetical protein
MFPEFYLRDSLNSTLVHQRIEEVRREMAEIHMGRLFADQAKARRRFFRMFWIRKFLFRLSSRLAYKVVMTQESGFVGGARNHVGS